MGLKGKSNTIRKVSGWIERRSIMVKLLMVAILLICFALAVKFMFGHSIYIYFVSEAFEIVGILVLIYKLTVHKTCAGLSLRSQELTAMYLASKCCSSLSLSQYLYAGFTFATLLPTLWVIYMMRVKLKSTYNAKLDNMPSYYVVVPCAVLAIVIHPPFDKFIVVRFLWGFSAYLEAISVLPQLRLIQKAKMVEPYIAHYVFALGIARFVGFVFWALQIYETGGRAFLFAVRNGYKFFWIPAVLLAEIVQTFILADFCYYYIKSLVNGQVVLRMPLPI